MHLKFMASMKIPNLKSDSIKNGRLIYEDNRTCYWPFQVINHLQNTITNWFNSDVRVEEQNGKINEFQSANR